MAQTDADIPFEPLIALSSVSGALWSEAWFDAANAAFEWYWAPLLEWAQADPSGTRLLDAPLPID